MKIYAKNLLTPAGVMRDQVLERAGEGEEGYEWVAPGYFDVHTHGGFGFDAVHSDPAGYPAWLEKLAAHGTTYVLAGIHTAKISEMRSALESVREVMRRQASGELGGARLLGAHLEGPFISLEALGAMRADCALAPTIQNFEAIAGGLEDAVRLVTLAPELPGALEMARYLNARGIRAQAGHTAATYEEGEAAFASGFGGVCHTFNASTPIRHRAPGILTRALLDDKIYCECICDLTHVHKGAVLLIYKSKGARRMIAISDAVSTTGLADGEYGGIIVKHGAAYTREGRLSGGGAQLCAAVKNLFGIGLPAEDALRVASLTPAEWLGLDLSTPRLCLDGELNLRRVLD